jgi:hypothetical protein
LWLTIGAAWPVCLYRRFAELRELSSLSVLADQQTAMSGSCLLDTCENRFAQSPLRPMRCRHIQVQHSTSLCSVDTSRCSIDLCSEDRSMCSTNLGNVDLSGCSSAPCGVYTFRSNKGQVQVQLCPLRYRQQQGLLLSRPRPSAALALVV